MSDPDTDDKTKNKDGDEERDNVALSLKQRTPMDIVIQIAAGLAAICAFVVGYISLTGWKSKESYGLWVSYIGIVLILLAVAAFIQKQLWENAAVSEQPPAPSNATANAVERPYVYFKFF